MAKVRKKTNKKKKNSRRGRRLMKVENQTSPIAPPPVGVFHPNDTISQIIAQNSNIPLQEFLRNYLITNNRQLLSQCYAEVGLIKTIIDIPVEDAFRGGITITSKQLSPDDVELLTKEIKVKKDIENTGLASKWKELFGGGGLIINTGYKFLEEPLTDDEILNNPDVSFKSFDLWEFSRGGPTNSRDADELDKLDILGLDYEHFFYYGRKIHRSRVILLRGLEAPSLIKSQLRGWGLSKVESLIPSIQQYLKNVKVTGEILDEYKIDILKIKGFNDALALAGTVGEDKIHRRLGMLNQQKSYNKSMSMDVDDDYIQKHATFSGLAEMMKEFRHQVASDMRMPETKLFGISSSGFNSGEDDIENYNAMIESSIRSPARSAILKIIHCRALSLFGHAPDDLDFEYESLRILKSTEEEEVKSKKFERIARAREMGEMLPLEFREAANEDNLLGPTLETEEGLLKEIDDQVTEKKEEEEKKGFF